MDQPPLIVVSGPPGAGKTTLSNALAVRFERAVVIPVDDIRLWVVSGISEPLPEWTDETARQFALAEEIAASAAKKYLAGGFAVVLDHCRIPANIDGWIDRCFADVRVQKVAIVPPLEVALSRNLARTNKAFDPAVLDPVIRGVHAAYADADLTDWIQLTGDLSVEQALDQVLSVLL